MSRLVALVWSMLAFVGASPVAAEERFALVIGNAGYRTIPALDNPANDAQLMTRTLRAKGFQVTTVVDADRTAMRRAVERFGEDLRAAPEGALALFFFAGHGVRSDGFNYLLPLGVDIRAEADIAREALAAAWVLEQIEVPGVTPLMVLDACRNNPFDERGAGTVPTLGDGLARMTPPDDSLIAYATGPGEVAFDGAGANSPYTAALSRAIASPGLQIEEIFARVRREVETATDGAQIPWESSSLEDAVFIRPEDAETALATPPGPPSGAPRLNISVGFRAARLGWGTGCSTVYHYAPVNLPASGEARRLSSTDARRRLPLELSARQGATGVEIRIVPVSRTRSGQEISLPLSDIARDGQHTVYTDARHPEFFGCGSMILYLSRER